MKKLWGGLILATAILLAMAHTNKPHIKASAPWSAPSVVNATSADGNIPEDPEAHLREMRDLRKQLKVLQADIDALKRQNRAAEH